MGFGTNKVTVFTAVIFLPCIEDIDVYCQSLACFCVFSDIKIVSGAFFVLLTIGQVVG